MEAVSEINVTPLIDLAFALLIIFMITAPLLQQSIDIQVPTDSPRAQAESPPEMILLAIDPTGQFFWATDPVSDGEMDARLQLVAMGTGPQPVVQVRADASIAYQRVVDLLDLVKKNGLNRLSLETRAR